MSQKPWLNQSSYARWVGDAVRMGTADGGTLISLFDSSVPEPRELLRQTIVHAVQPEFGKKVVTAFGGGNRFVVGDLAERYAVERCQVLCTSGATAALGLVYRTFARPGDHILVERPGFDLFADLAVDLGIAWSGFARSGPEFSIDLAGIEASIRPETKLIVLSNLHNPSGMAVDHEDLARLARLAEQRGILLVVDEVYGDYAGPEVRPCPAFRLSPAVISISSLTKIFGLGNMRCGWLVGDAGIVEQVRETSMRVDFGVSSLSHAIAAYVFERYAEFEDYSRTVLAAARPIFADWYAGMQAEGLVEGKLPEAGCIAFPRLPTIDDAAVFSQFLLRRSSVLVAPGYHFGAPQHVRIGFAHAPEVLAAGLDALEAGIRAYGAGER